MHSLVVFAVLVYIIEASPSGQEFSRWEDFKMSHGKVYSDEEERLRYSIFSDNLKIIEEHNFLYEAGLSTYRMGVNQFADMTQEEFRNYLTLTEPDSLLQLKADHVYVAPEGIELPENIDYRELNAVNPVKNQGSCGSCWAFSTVGTLESHYFLKTGRLLSFSEQNLVDCSRSYGNYGCQGGWMQYGFNYIKDHGIESENDYPYRAHESSCKFKKSETAANIKGYTDVKRGSEHSLQAAVATVGPVAIAVDATGWSFYNSGIYSSYDKTTQLNHAVIVIGYGSENGEDYWIVRNSWSKNWGEDGYIRIARNAGNQVGITDAPCYPNL